MREIQVKRVWLLDELHATEKAKHFEVLRRVGHVYSWLLRPLVPIRVWKKVALYRKNEEGNPVGFCAGYSVIPLILDPSITAFWFHSANSKCRANCVWVDKFLEDDVHASMYSQYYLYKPYNYMFPRVIDTTSEDGWAIAWEEGHAICADGIHFFLDKTAAVDFPPL